jgi:hypothetical protein
LAAKSLYDINKNRAKKINEEKSKKPLFKELPFSILSTAIACRPIPGSVSLLGN